MAETENPRDVTPSAPPPMKAPGSTTKRPARMLMTKLHIHQVLMVALAGSLIAGACDDKAGNQTADASTTADAAQTDAIAIDSGPPDATPTTAVELAIGFVGPVDTMTGFDLTVTGTRSIANEAQVAGAPATQASTFDASIRVDLANDSLRIDYNRTISFLGGLGLMYKEIYVGNLGAVDGTDGVFGPTVNMASSRWASGRKQQVLLNPHFLLRKIIATPSLAIEVGELDHGGTTFRVFEVEDAVAPIRMWVNPIDGRIERATTLVSDPLLRDMELVVSYANWSSVEGIQFPNDVTIALGSDTIHTETRSAVDVNPTFAADVFNFPLDASPMFVASLAAIGEKSHQFFQSFAAIGIPLDTPSNFISATELAPGVFHLTGGSHHSLAVEQANGLVIVEAPLSPERADALIAWAASQFPGKTITHVVATHHHQDHTAGLRSFVAAGATVVMHTASRDFFNSEVFAAPSTIVPDSLSQAPLAATFQVVPVGGSVALGDATNPITIYPLASSHADDVTIIHVVSGGSGYLFQSDLYNPGNGGSSLNPAFAQELLTGIQSIAGGLTVDTLVGGHGGVAPLSELVDFLAP